MKKYTLLLTCFFCFSCAPVVEETPVVSVVKEAQGLPVRDLGKRHLSWYVSCQNGSENLTGFIEQYYDGQVFTGDLDFNRLSEFRKTYYPKGVIATQSQCRRGVLDGVSRAYYKNGQLKNQYSYDKGFLNGNAYEYDAQGVLRAQIAYKNGQRDGLSISYRGAMDVYEMVNYTEGEVVSGVCVSRDGERRELRSDELLAYSEGALRCAE
ncbi:MAG: hypothetical protein LBU87_00975 [Lactobacillales bacterium]|nr:hypothetical protein [Lactobacillales bacterium]